MNKIKLNENIIFGGDKLVITAGPCAIEDDISINWNTRMWGHIRFADVQIEEVSTV